MDYFRILFMEILMMFFFEKMIVYVYVITWFLFFSSVVSQSYLSNVIQVAEACRD